MSFCDDSNASYPVRPVRRVAASPSLGVKPHANNDFANLSNAALAAKDAAWGAFVESTTPLDAATKYLTRLNRILTNNLWHKTTNDDLKIALDGVDAIETYGNDACIRAKKSMRTAIEHWMRKETYTSEALYLSYSAPGRTGMATNISL